MAAEGDSTSGRLDGAGGRGGLPRGRPAGAGLQHSVCGQLPRSAQGSQGTGPGQGLSETAPCGACAMGSSESRLVALCSVQLVETRFSREHFRKKLMTETLDALVKYVHFKELASAHISIMVPSHRPKLPFALFNRLGIALFTTAAHWSPQGPPFPKNASLPDCPPVTSEPKVVS